MNGDTLDTKYFRRMPNIDICRLFDYEVSGSRCNQLEHIQGKVHHTQKMRAKTVVARTKRRRIKEEGGEGADKKAKRSRRAAYTHQSVSAPTSGGALFVRLRTSLCRPVNFFFGNIATPLKFNHCFEISYKTCKFSMALILNSCTRARDTFPCLASGIEFLV